MATATSFGPHILFDETENKREFIQVDGSEPEKFEMLSEIFHRILTPLYGSQEKALRQIKEGLDRKCFLLYEGKQAVGVLQFKTILSDEFSDLGVSRSIEIKSLFVDHSVNNSGRGLGSALVDKLKEEVDQLGLKHLGIHVTVSETKKESLMFFQKKGFEIAHKWQDRYIKGTAEYLLSCPSRIQQAIPSLVEKFTRLWIRDINYLPKGEPPELIHVIHNAHSDDIHAIKKLSDETILSGSKDNCLYKWNREGEQLKIVQEVEPTNRTQRDWISAVAVINDAYWVSGERNGKIFLWKTNGDYVKELHLARPRFGEHVSRRENQRRVNCLAAGLSPSKPSFFVGFPTMFDQFNLIEGRTEYISKVHDNDWVYCINPLTEDKLLAVTGCTLDLWNKTERGWEYGENLIPEWKKTKNFKGKWQRPFISSVTQLKSDPNHFGIASFDGSVKIFDLEAKKQTKRWKEHKGRVWMIENVSENVFASSGEDRTIRFWDVREQKSIHTIADHVGQVSSLLSYNENLLLAGTCPENPIFTGNGAEIRYYDVRK